MPRLADPLTELQIRKAKAAAKAYTLSDGNGLSLLVSPAGRKTWSVRYRLLDGTRPAPCVIGHYGEYVTAGFNVIISYLKTHYNDAFLLYLESCRAVVYRKLEELARRDPSIEFGFAGTTAIEWNGTGYEQPTFDSRVAASSSMINQLNC